MEVSTHPDREAMGRAAAQHVANLLGRVLEKQGTARVVFACAPSQDDFLAALASPPLRDRVDWSRVTAFHMDDYVGLNAEHPESFRHYLKEHLLDHVGIKEFHPIMSEADDIERFCARYESMLAKAPIDLICLGIGENGHIAFNDPPVADFEDPRLVKVVELDVACRRQQVNDGCFPAMEEVPERAVTLTIPVFKNARHLSCVVPGERKAAAVARALEGPVETACPASILQTHPDCHIFLDTDSSAGLNK